MVVPAPWRSLSNREKLPIGIPVLNKRSGSLKKIPYCAQVNRKKWRYSRIQVTAFIVSCLSLIVYETHSISAMSEIVVEIFLLLWRGINEFLHDEFDFSAVWHHGGFLLVYMIFQYNQRWQKQYCDLAVRMQILHFPMALWYLGGRYHSIFSDPSLRSVCVLLFRPLWNLSVAFRLSSMAMATLNSLGLQEPFILSALTCVYFLLDLYWSSI
uniref:TLC domain-containing protein n=1 Tax=Hanusia phi TaxID=3032 RepID=A0A7S0HS96_9CRYP|mmetsp:Transcript_33570/g.75418  ORF Transcript_33570/g.75418 Transcript_33570/m.75418 type:complete len:212 (+) Transcript_33570:13-648(+)